MKNFTDTYSIEWIAIKNLSVVWASAQREYNDRRAKKIADSFDPDLFDNLVVTLPNGDGIYHVVDGQHRRGAVSSLYGEDEKVPCRIVMADSPARAATIFHQINTGRTAPSALERFRVKITGRSETEIAINNMVYSLGCRIEMNTGPRSIRAVSSLLFVYKSFGLAVLRETLMTIISTWDGDKGAFDGPLIEGFASLVAQHQKNMNYEHLRRKTAKQLTPGRLLAQAKSDKEALGGRMADGVRRVLIRNYNTGIRSGKLDVA